MYIYIYVYIYICTYTYIKIHNIVYTYICTNVLSLMSECMYAYTNLFHTFIHTYIHIYDSHRSRSGRSAAGPHARTALCKTGHNCGHTNAHTPDTIVRRRARAGIRIHAKDSTHLRRTRSRSTLSGGIVYPRHGVTGAGCQGSFLRERPRWRHFVWA
jgi:hypothetical protein